MVFPPKLKVPVGREKKKEFKQKMLFVPSRTFHQETKKNTKCDDVYGLSPQVDSPSLGENDVQPIKSSFAIRVEKCSQGKVAPV